MQSPLIRNSSKALGMQSSGRQLVARGTRDPVVGLSHRNNEFPVIASGRIEMSRKEGNFKYKRDSFRFMVPCIDDNNSK
jgi:hypothetical protein